MKLMIIQLNSRITTMLKVLVEYLTFEICKIEK